LPAIEGISLERKLVKSSNIKSIGYNGTNKCLEIEFNNGGIYEYCGVPNEIYVSLMSAPSHGKYFNQYIKNLYSFNKVK